MDSGTTRTDGEDSNVLVMNRGECGTNGEDEDDKGDVCGAREQDSVELLSVGVVSVVEVT